MFKISIAIGLLLGANVCAVSAAEQTAKSAAGDPAKAKLLRMFAIAAVSGQCNIVFQKQPHVSVGGRVTNSQYLASNDQLHTCQYFQEMEARSCLKTNTCPSYRQWSAKNKAFSPKLQRSTFVAMLENRRNMIDAITTARERKRATKARNDQSSTSSWVQVSERIDPMSYR